MCSVSPAADLFFFFLPSHAPSPSVGWHVPWVGLCMAGLGAHYLCVPGGGLFRHPLRWGCGRVVAVRRGVGSSPGGFAFHDLVPHLSPVSCVSGGRPSRPPGPPRLCEADRGPPPLAIGSRQVSPRSGQPLVASGRPWAASGPAPLPQRPRPRRDGRPRGSRALVCKRADVVGPWQRNGRLARRHATLRRSPEFIMPCRHVFTCRQLYTAYLQRLCRTEGCKALWHCWVSGKLSRNVPRNTVLRIWGGRLFGGGRGGKARARLGIALPSDDMSLPERLPGLACRTRISKPCFGCGCI